MDFPFSDRALSQRLERAEAESNARFVEARARVSPESGATWIEVAGAYVLFDGISSPCTQTFGLGMFEPVTDAVLEEIESFFEERGSPTFHEVSPLAGPQVMGLLSERGYRPIELSSVLYRPIGTGLDDLPRNPEIRVRTLGEDESEVWARTSARGWSHRPELTEFLLELSAVTTARENGVSFLAELGGKPIAAAAMSLCSDVMLLAGASTVPEARRQGAQLALLDHRLRYAAEAGCELAMMGAEPGSPSQRNAERHGFRIAYTRIKWQLAC
jgi:GNAT superfamily N-acetyltransferase